MDRLKFIEDMENPDIYISSPREITKTIKKNLDKKGHYEELDVAMEECAELIQAVSKAIRGQDAKAGVLEEMADVHIILQTLAYIFEFDEADIQKAITIKCRELKKKW